MYGVFITMVSSPYNWTCLLMNSVKLKFSVWALKAQTLPKQMEALINRLEAANLAYRNGEKLLMTDEEYDANLELLAKMSPNHPLLTTLRAAPGGGKTVPMPYYLGSLDKVKEEAELQKWIGKQGASSEICVAEKLDGISGLWNPKQGRLYLSGDENMGVDVSEWLRFVKCGEKPVDASKISPDVWIRGELILPRSAIPEGRLGRSIVNGIFHRDVPDAAAAGAVRFVSYEIFSVGKPFAVSQQFKHLKTWGCYLPWLTSINPKAENLGKTLNEWLAKRREESEYDMDGLVLRSENPAARVAKGNPKDAVAWKPPTGESKLTRVIAVEWNASANGRLIPRVQIEPTALGGSTIQYVTGTHARRVVDWSIGPGAQVILRKGGDVIPVLDKVTVPAAVVMPPAGTYEWEGDATTAVHIRQKTGDASTVAAQLIKVAKNLGWDGVGPSQMEALVKADLTTIPKIRATPLAALQKLLGPTKGANLHKLVQSDGWMDKTEIDLYIASPVAQVGIGRGRLEALAKAESDCRKWSAMSPPAGWTEESLRIFLENWSAYEIFRKTQWNFIHYPQPLIRTSVTLAASAAIPQKGTVVFSGFRNDDLETKLAAKGYKVVDTVKGDCKAVLIADTKDPDTYSSTKTEKAKKIPGCQILKCADWGRL
jgi:hypothetical protein